MSCRRSSWPPWPAPCRRRPVSPGAIRRSRSSAVPTPSPEALTARGQASFGKSRGQSRAAARSAVGRVPVDELVEAALALVLIEKSQLALVEHLEELFPGDGFQAVFGFIEV